MVQGLRFRGLGFGIGVIVYGLGAVWDLAFRVSFAG